MGFLGEFSQGGSNSFRLFRLVYFSDSIVFLRDYVPDSLDVFFSYFLLWAIPS